MAVFVVWGRANPPRLWGRLAGKGGVKHPAAPQADHPGPPADDAVQPVAKNALVRNLQQQLESAQQLGPKETFDPLLGMLSDADEALTLAKLRNREAIRQANRQLRVGAGRLTPHLILIVADSLSPNELGAYGKEPSVTPSLDRLAANGIRFSNYYAGGPDPEAGFWSLMTGRNASQAPRNSASPYQIHDGNQTFAEVLWNGGYATTFFGIWTGAGRPIEHGFDEWVGRVPTHTAAEAFPEILLTGRSHMRVLENSGGNRQASFPKLLAAETESFLERTAKFDRPYLLVVRLPSPAVCQNVADASDPRAAALAVWDDFVGGLCQQLDEHNLRRRVCIMFTALSGRGASESVSLRKGSRPLEEDSLRAPLIVSWAGGVPRDSVCDHVCAAWDLLPTCIELARVSSRPANLDGISFNAALHQQTQAEHPLLFWESRGTPHAQAVRKGKWKGVFVTGEAGVRLYDLEKDPGETTNLAAEFPDVVQQLILKPRKVNNQRG